MKDECDYNFISIKRCCRAEKRYEITAEDVIMMIKTAPTVDAVPVVRCRECNHCDPENYHCDHPMGTAAPLRRKPDDFCSYGERKGSADNEM